MRGPLTLAIIGSVLAIGACGSDSTGNPGAAKPTSSGSSKPIASRTVSIPIKGLAISPGSSDPDATVKVDVLELRRDGKLVRMTAKVTPRNSIEGTQPLNTVLNEFQWSPKLIDGAGLKEYAAVEVAGEALQTNGDLTDTASGRPTTVHAVFAAPPVETERVTLIFAGAVAPFEDLPLR